MCFTFQCLLTVFYIVYGEALQLLEYITFVEGVISAVAVWCVLSMRYYQPNRKRPIKVSDGGVMEIFYYIMLTKFSSVDTYHSRFKFVITSQFYICDQILDLKF